ncbi:MAG: hypothetical protein AB7N76_19830 [Planctomycetota bacterium]
MRHLPVQLLPVPLLPVPLLPVPLLPVPLLLVPLLLVPLLLAASPALAAERPWNTPAAREDAAQVLQRVQALVRETERGDARPAVAALDDPSWILRRVAALRLGALGLAPELADALARAAVPGAPPLARSAEARRAAEALTVREPEAMPVPEVSAGDAARVVCSVVTLYVREGKEQQPARRALLAGLLAYRAALFEARDRGFLAQVLLEALDPALVLPELGLKQPADVAKEGGRALFRWFEQNEAYLFWHPRGRVFLVDRAAREAQQGTEAYRKGHPWAKGEGPAAPRERPQK